MYGSCIAHKSWTQLTNCGAAEFSWSSSYFKSIHKPLDPLDFVLGVGDYWLAVCGTNSSGKETTSSNWFSLSVES